MDRAHESRPEWSTARGRLNLASPIVFGILNVTPDSFSDGGIHATVDAAVARALAMADEGADVIDVGGESTRPGAVAITAEEECARVIPVVSAIAKACDVHISIDTTKAVVAERALAAGASIINDVSALRLDPHMGETAARYGAGMVLMHSRGDVADMASYQHATYDDVVADVTGELMRSVAGARAAGVSGDAIALDPGLGFSKRTEHSIALLAHLDRIVALGYPVLAGPSRKRFVGDVAGGLAVDQRLEGTVAACVAAVLAGARMVRVHDVAAVRRALAVADAVVQARTAV